MVTSADFAIFERYKNAGEHAFSNNIVTEEDKDRYQSVFEALLAAAHSAISVPPYSNFYRVWNSRFFRDGGVQGQRPVDLWAAVINVESEVLARYPQVYAIASDQGIELGCGIAIHENDYYNTDIKRRNRSIVPVLYNKLPSPDSELITSLDERLKREPGWLFGLKTRQGALGTFGSLAEMIRFLKSGESSAQGGGAIYRIISPDNFDSAEFSLAREYADAVRLFTPLMRTLVPSGNEQARLESQEAVDNAANALPEFDPSGVEDGRKKVFQEVAVRQGQAKFREKLLSAYGSRCAVTGTAVVATLQAAHVFPYRGPDTNKVQNGILLRADIHNLFDLGLISIDPESYRIVITDELRGSSFAKLEGRQLRLPAKKNDWPSKPALLERKNFFAGKGRDKN